MLTARFWALGTRPNQLLTSAVHRHLHSQNHAWLLLNLLLTGGSLHASNPNPAPRCYAGGVEYERFVYPCYDEPTACAYAGAFEAVYILLHPFVRLPDELASLIERYPDDEQLISFGSKCSWAFIGERLGLASYPKLSRALLTSTRSIVDELCDFAASDSLNSFLETNPIWTPSNGGFDPLLRSDYLSAFDSSGNPELVFVPEFPAVDKSARLSVSQLRNGAAPFPYRGTLITPDCSFLLTVDWDSFFTLMFGSRALLESIVCERKLEGFYATQTTKHFWFKDADEEKSPAKA